MHAFLPLTVLLVAFSAECSEKYKPSSRTTHQAKRNNVIRLDSREFYIQEDIPKRVSSKRKVHPPAVPPPIPMYRQESTIGFDGSDLRSVSLQGGGTRRPTPAEPPIPVRRSIEAQQLDTQLRGMERLEGRSRCCDRAEGQTRPRWFMWLFGRCLGERR